MATGVDAVHAAQTSERVEMKTWLGLFALLLAAFMNFVDGTIVNVALPTLQTNFSATSTQIEWVVAGYVLFFALGLLPFGRLGDSFSRKYLFLFGVFCFTAASALCGLAQSMETLIIARIIQGISGAVMMPQVMSIIHVTFPPEQRNSAFAMFGLTAGLASVSGPVLGGLLIDANLGGWGWRWIFMVNIPVGIICFLVGLMVLPKHSGNRQLKMDWGGILLSMTAILLIVFPLIEGQSLDWPVWLFFLMGLSIVFIALFYNWESRQARLGQSELLPLRLLTNHNFLVGAVIVTAFFSGLPAFFMALALFLQLGFGLSPLESGLTAIPFPIGVLIASILSGIIGSRWPKLRLIGGIVVLIGGMTLLFYTVSHLVTPLDRFQFVAPLFFSGVGMGVAIAAMFETVLRGVPEQDAGSGSGALQALQQVGGALGIAALGHVFFTTLGNVSTTGNQSFITAMSNAVIYELIVFSIVLVLAFLLRPSSAT